MEYRRLSLEEIKETMEKFYSKQPQNDRRIKIHLLSIEAYKAYCKAIQEEGERRIDQGIRTIS